MLKYKCVNIKHVTGLRFMIEALLKATFST